MIRFLLTAALVSLAAFAPAQPPLRIDEVSDLAEKIKRARDEADEEEIARLAEIGTRAAAEAMVDVYGSMGSIYMRLEVLKKLPRFDGVAEAEQLALQKLMDIATESQEKELRDAALDALGSCQKLGKSFLAMIVDSPAEDDIRERAMDLHVAMSTKDDHAWYRKIYEREKAAEEPVVKKRDKRKKKDDEDTEPELKVHKLASLRRKAFEVIAPELSLEEVEKALKEPGWRLRLLAFQEYDRREPKKALALAEEVYSDLDGTHPELRIFAAKLLAADQGKKIADRFIEDGQKFMTPTQLRNALADLLADFRDKAVEAKLVKLVGRGKVYEKLFSLRAVRKVDDDKLNKKIQKLLGDKEVDVCIAAARVLAERGDVTAVKPLEKLIEKSKDPVLIAEGLDAMSKIRGKDPEWDAQLVEYTKNEDMEVRNAALMQLGKDGRTDHFDLFGPALKDPQWSTRYAALRGLASMRDVRAIPLIIEQMKSEEGRMLVEFADVLFELTGKPYRTAMHSWEAWWKNEGAGFEIISTTELEKAREAEELRRLKQITNVKFFGIRIISHRVIFIIDVSGSMNEEMRARYVGEGGTTRIEVAKRELTKCIDGLDIEALFNIITFSDGVNRWLQEGIAGSDEKSREEAREHVSRLGAGGATNLYDALRTAFDDPDVDTIFVLSDGEPNVGKQTDITVIRDHVRSWNEHRGVVINTIGIGGSFDVLEWLAEDSAGTHVRFR